MIRAMRSRGRPRRRQQQQGLRELAIVGPIVERGQRRRRNKAGRYEPEYLVEFATEVDGPVQQQWLRIAEYNALIDDSKLEDELDGDGE